ncbi:MAG: NAD-dependent epimerase/dehydratase family protein, partial [Myxococcales bacterium]|nr:NAD-dependent epimerase/dehydratase family protein [Polyangiaceae bacterium]MDW8248681.1 NAD-dependent epimerase/dehydratase family protein [Myxococcales bacterium]
MSRIVVTGGSGFVGARLLPALLERGHQVTVLGRHTPDSRLPSEVKSARWTPEEAGPWFQEIEG